MLQKEIGRMRSSLALLNERKGRQVDKKIEYQEAIQYAEEEAIAQNNALTRELTRKERIEKSIVEVTYIIESKTKELQGIEEQMSVANSKINEIERNIRDQKVVMAFYS